MKSIEMRAAWRPTFIGALLALMMLIQLLGEGSLIAIQGSSILVIAALLFVTWSYPPSNKLQLIPASIFALFSTSLIWSGVASSSVLGEGVMIRIIAVLLIFFVGFLLATRSEHQILEKAFPVFAFCFTFVLFIVLIDNDRNFERLRGHLHPNLWGFVASTSIVGLLFLRAHWLWRLASIVFVLYLLAIEFQTRGALIWATFGIVTFGTIKMALSIRSSRYPPVGVAALPILAAALIILAMSLSEWISSALQIDSATRGYDSGLTGRTELWSFFLEKFIERPLFGHGFDMSRFYAENYDSTDKSSTHNSFLTILFDLGVSGLFFYVLIILIAIFGAIKHRKFLFIAFFCVYVLNGMTESRPLNAGNPSAILFLLLLPYCSTLAFSNRKAAGTT